MGAGLARDAGTSVGQTHRGDAIAGKPAPTKAGSHSLIGFTRSDHAAYQLLAVTKGQVVHQFRQRQRLADQVTLGLITAE